MKAHALRLVRSPWFFWGVLALATLLRLLCSGGMMVLFLPGTGYDDVMQTGKAITVANGLWLGDYNSLTLVKGAGYPLLAALFHKLGLPFIFAWHLLYTGGFGGVCHRTASTGQKPLAAGRCLPACAVLSGGLFRRVDQTLPRHRLLRAGVSLHRLYAGLYAALPEKGGAASGLRWGRAFRWPWRPTPGKTATGSISTWPPAYWCGWGCACLPPKSGGRSCCFARCWCWALTLPLCCPSVR